MMALSGSLRPPVLLGMETIDRQHLIGGHRRDTPESGTRRRVQVIVGVTPDEGTGYLAGEE